VSLAGKHAVVTGGGTGIGAAAAEELARLGARLTVVGRRRDKLETERAKLGAEHNVLALDLTRADDVATAFARLAPIDILVNNAGAAESAPFAKSDLALLERMLAANLGTAWVATQAALKAGATRIVNVASIAGVTGAAYVSAYCASKHALIGMTRALARELAPQGITVNAVCPGYTETDMVARAAENIAAKTGRSVESARADLARSNPTGRLVAPAEVAAAIGFLCLPAAAQITGQAIVIAGGEEIA
jgi:NAD(P)-dependent dehydrogenase (short-subunit alcohol dehydrogenase family)